MVKLTERSREDLVKALDLIDTVCTLAAANFPFNTDVVIETSGSRQIGKIHISSYTLRIAADYARAQLVRGAMEDAGRSALNEEERK